MANNINMSNLKTVNQRTGNTLFAIYIRILGAQPQLQIKHEHGITIINKNKQWPLTPTLS